MLFAQLLLLQLSGFSQHRDLVLPHSLTKESIMTIKFSDVAYYNISQSTLVDELDQPAQRDRSR
jgi:hypothetical protein